ncbi:MAG: AraC family transcriptional regulator, partial [Planctomycetaceae bacterium]|nr:AraC family transcriptional regulator [Planctomycetaceae bacterium]
QLLGGVINRILGRMLVLDKTAAVEAEPAADDAVAKILAYLDDHVEGEVDFKTLPDMTGMRYDKFSRLFHSATGMTPHQYYLDKKIKAAITLLQSGLSVKETSYRLSFDSPFYFSRLFKKKTGESPQAFKNRTP